MRAGWHINLAQSKDIKTLVAIEQAVFKQTDGRISKRQFHYHQQKQTGLWVIKDQQEQVAGYILVLYYKRSVRLYSLAIAPQLQGLGLAKLLLNHVINHEKTKHFQRITLEVRDSNKKAQQLYKSLGFTKSKVKKNYYEDEDAIKMALIVGVSD